MPRFSSRPTPFPEPPTRRTRFVPGTLGMLLAAVAVPGGVAGPPESRAAAITEQPALPWGGLESPPGDLAAVQRAVRAASGRERQETLEGIAADPALAARARGAASFRLGEAALRQGRWTVAAQRLTAPELGASALAADGLHLLGESLPRARAEAIPALRRLLAEFPEYARSAAAQLELGRRLDRAGTRAEALAHFEAAAARASFTLRGEALSAAATTLERLGRLEAAVRTLETLYYDMPGHRRSLSAGQRLSRLYRGPGVESPPAAARYPAAMRRADGFARAGNHRRAHENYLEVSRRFASAADEELVRLRIGVEEFHRGRLSASLRTLGRIRRADLRPEALYYRGESLRRLERLTTQSRVLEELLALDTEHDFGERALYSLARARLAQNDREAALPYLRRLAEAYPTGERHGLFARWHVLWDRYRNGHLEGTAAAFERTAREHPGDFMAGQFLYFAGRSLERTGDPAGAASLFREVFVGYQNSFYGRRAAERLAEIGASDALRSPLGEPDLLLDRFRVERTGEAARIEELHAAGFPDRALGAARNAARAGLPDDAAFHAMAGWLLAERDRHVPAIQALRRAAPFFTSAAGEALPPAWWQLLYPLRYGERLRTRSARWDLDPHLVAGLIRQESAFAPRTRSPVGARGLMQIMPATGRALARLEGLTYQVSRLYDPVVNIRFGTRYLRQLLDEFGDRPELALAGYNAGPHRVRAWTQRDLSIPAEQFIEEIPFTETRNYVKLVLRNEMLYRRLYPELAGAPADE